MDPLIQEIKDALQPVFDFEKLEGVIFLLAVGGAVVHLQKKDDLEIAMISKAIVDGAQQSLLNGEQKRESAEKLVHA